MGTRQIDDHGARDGRDTQAPQASQAQTQATQAQAPTFSSAEVRAAWVQACRIRTLPLAAAGSVVAAGLAAAAGQFRLPVFVLMFLTSVMLQVIANFADDYGDLASGLDDETRVGPKRGMQRGIISVAQMKRVLIGMCAATFVVGVALVAVAFAGGPTMTGGSWLAMGVFVLLGVASIVAAITYTIGKHPYGYMGLGDIVSGLFFGIVAVVGGSFLYLHTFSAASIVAALALTLPVMGVMNVNNMRDSKRDRAKGKRTIANLLGDPAMRVYQSVLLGASAVLFVVAMALCGVRAWPAYVALVLSWALWARVLLATWKIPDPEKFDRLMAPTSMGTVLVALVWTISVALAS